MKNQKNTEYSVDFNRLEPELKGPLEKKGWTEEQWNSVSQEERDQAIRCI
jgi:hypothetical protein